MGATSWTEAALIQTGWDSTAYPPGTQFVLIGGVVMPVDANGNPVAVLDPTVWTEASQSATSFTKKTVSVTSWTEASG